MKLVAITVILVVMVLTTGNTLADSPCPGNWGTELGSFRGVIAYSNGSLAECFATGFVTAYGTKWQCVEFVKRFYGEEVGDPITQSWGYASSAFDLGSPSVNKYANGGTMCPHPGDVLCFDDGEYGHVGIITEVSTNYVKIIDQNRTDSENYIILQLSMNVSSGHYTVSGFGSDPYYAVEGWLRDPDYNPVTYSCDYDSQSPSGAIYMVPGETKTFTVYFKNTGTTTWYNNQGSHPNDYITLKSVGQNGVAANSWLYSSGLGWIDSQTPCTMQESSISHDGVATFTFTGKVPTDASVGQHIIYFRPHHSTGGMLSDWGGMNFDIRVLAQLTGSNFIAFVGDFNGDGKKDAGLWETTAGTWYISVRDASSTRYIRNDTPWLTGWANGGGYKLVVADFNHDGKDDLGLYYYSLGRWFVAYSYGSYFAQVSGYYTNGSWLDGWATGDADDWIPFAGNFSTDSYPDIGVYYPSSGGWFVAFNNLQLSPPRLIQQPGPSPNPWWLTGWGTGSYGEYWPFVGYIVGGDVYEDVGLYHPGTGRLFVAADNKQPDQFCSNGLWLDAFPSSGGTSAWRVFCGKSSVDTYDDVIVYLPSYGRWYVAWNWATYFAKAVGIAADGSWLTGWATEDGQLNWQTFAGDESGDAYVDLIAYTPQLGRWFVAYNNAGYGNFTPANGPCINGSWLDGWGVVSGSPKRSVETEIPMDFSISQNYPNPFNAQTFISYSLPQSSHVRIDIYNILGQNISTLIDDYQEPGEHQIIWNAGGQPTGVYFYRIVTEGNSETRKMLLIK